VSLNLTTEATCVRIRI